MNDDSNSTKRPTKQVGPVTAAIRAVREPAAPWFVPIQPEDRITSGYHVGRRRDWEDLGRQEMVYLLVDQDDGDWRWSVWRCGGSKPENPAEWDFTLRVGGIRSMPADPIELRVTRH